MDLEAIMVMLSSQVRQIMQLQEIIMQKDEELEHLRAELATAGGGRNGANKKPEVKVEAQS
jgi:hypothetical protein